MANYTGGDITELVCKHEIGTIRFSVKAGESGKFDTGGLRSNDDDGAVTGDGQMIDQITRKRWSLECTILVDMMTENEIKKIPELATSPIQGIWTVSHITGTVYKGKGKPVGDLKWDSNNAQMTLKVSGGGMLEKL